MVDTIKTHQSSDITLVAIMANLSPPANGAPTPTVSTMETLI